MSAHGEKAIEDLLDKIFTGKYKDRYEIGFCHLCNVHYIICPDCNGGGCYPRETCDLCKEDIEYFVDNVENVCNYLTVEEMEILEKAKQIRKFLKMSHEIGKTEIDWEYIGVEGKSSKRDEEFFPILKQYQYKYADEIVCILKYFCCI